MTISLTFALAGLCGQCGYCKLAPAETRSGEYRANLDDDESPSIEGAIRWAREAYPACEALTTTTYGQRLARYEHAFNARRLRLATQCDAATISGRVLQQPTMANPSGPGYREQPRDGRGRLLGRRWLAAAETYSAADHAWFRSSPGSTPVGEVDLAAAKAALRAGAV